MNRWEIEVQKSLLDSEEAALKELERQYTRALKEVSVKIRQFQSDIATLDEALSQAGLDDTMKTLLQSQKQSKIYQQQYQKALQQQIGSILDKMHGDNYTTVDAYLHECYEKGYVGTMYSLAQQGMPIIAPIDQAAEVKAILTDTKMNESLYDALGVDTAKLKKAISQEISRGIATGMGYSSIARNISMVSNAPLSRTKTIARTEGHRIQEASTYDAAMAAKQRGIDQVKQWDASLDGKTRDSHRQVDGEIKELDEKFSNGLMYPGDPNGGAAEVVNCRCALLVRARAALDESELEVLKERAEYFGLDKTENFKEFEEKYLNASKTLEKSGKSDIILSKKLASRNMSNVATGGKRNESPLTALQIKEAKEAAEKQGYIGEVLYSEYTNTSFHYSSEGAYYHYLVIGTDAFPALKNGGSANERISLNGCMAHEVVGHYEAWIKGTAKSSPILEEVQASIRASKFGVGLTDEEREILYQDALDRLLNVGINLKDIEDTLDIWER